MSTKHFTDEFVSKFWANLDMQSLFDCWIWQKARSTYGYGHICDKRKVFLTHRISWEMHFGPIPKDVCVLHKCDNPPCANPAHLFLGTRADNAKDKIQKGRQPRGENVRGAILTEDKVLNIRKLRKEGWEIKRLAAYFKIKSKHVEQIIYRQSWKHI